MATKYFIGTDGSYSTSGNWSPSGVPAAADDVIITAGSGAITSGLDQSAVTIKSFTREIGHAGAIGNGLNDPLKLVVGGAGSFVDLGGTNTAYINLGSSTAPVKVREAGGASTNGIGLYLLGTGGITLLTVLSGSVRCVGFSVKDGELLGGTTFFDYNCTLTDSGNALFFVSGSAQVTIEAAVDDVRVSGGQLTINGSGAVSDIFCDGGLVISNTSGTVAKITADGQGRVDLTKSGVSRTVTDMTRSGSGIIDYNPNVVTLTNRPTSAGPMRLSAAA